MFVETLNYWRKRKKNHGDKAVGNVAEDINRQGAAIGAELIKFLKGNFFDHGLDFGCGWGRLLPYITPYCGHVWAVDLFSDWTDRAAAHSKTVTGVVASDYHLPFEDNAFDLVVDSMTLQSVNEKDVEVVARELSRVAVCGATVISLNKADFVRGEPETLTGWLGIENVMSFPIKTIDKKDDLYCLIVGTHI